MRRIFVITFLLGVFAQVNVAFNSKFVISCRNLGPHAGKGPRLSGSTKYSKFPLFSKANSILVDTDSKVTHDLKDNLFFLFPSSSSSSSPPPSNDFPMNNEPVLNSRLVSEVEETSTNSPPQNNNEKYSLSLLFTALSAAAIAISYVDRSNLSTAIIPMTAQFHWDSFFSGLVLSSFWAGYSLTQVIGGRIADRLGGEKLLVGAMLIWSACTFLTPITAGWGNAFLIVDRVLLGAGEGFALPAIHSMIQKYVAPKDRSFSASAVTAACYLGALISNFLSPILIEKFTWQTCFEAFAAIPPLLWLPLWLIKFVFNNSSNSTSSSSTNEQVVSTSSPTSSSTTTTTANPQAQKSSTSKYSITDVSQGPRSSLRSLLSSPPVLAIIAAQYGQSWGMIGLLSWLPTYYSQRFGVPVASLGSFTALPYLLQMIAAVSAGALADRLISSGMRVLSVRNTFQVIGMLVPAVCLMLCAYLPALTSLQAAGLITMGSTISAITVAAVSCNHFDIAPRNAGTVFAMGNTASCLGGLIAVPAAGAIFDRTQSWDAVFLLFAAHYIGGALLWSLWSSDQPIAADMPSSSP